MNDGKEDIVAKARRTSTSNNSSSSSSSTSSSSISTGFRLPKPFRKSSVCCYGNAINAILYIVI